MYPVMSLAKKKIFCLKKEKSVYLLLTFPVPPTYLPCLVNVFKERLPRQATLLFPTIIWAPLALVPS